MAGGICLTFFENLYVIFTFFFTKFLSLGFMIIIEAVKAPWESFCLSEHRNMERNEEQTSMKEIYGIIRKLGITSNYKGYYFVADAIQLAMNAQDVPMKITKDVYPYLASKYKTKTLNVEHNIRTVINVCWETNRKGMAEIAGHPLNYKPTNSDFIDMVAYYLLSVQES